MVDAALVIKGITEIINFLLTFKEIHDSVEGNRTELYNVAESIVSSLLVIQGVIERQEREISVPQYAVDAVNQLEIGLQVILSKCQRMMLAEENLGWLGRLKMRFTEWNDRHEIRALLTRLQKDVDDIRMRFLFDVAAGTAVNVAQLHAMVEELCATIQKMNDKIDPMFRTMYGGPTDTLQLSDTQAITLNHAAQAADLYPPSSMTFPSTSTGTGLQDQYRYGNPGFVSMAVPLVPPSQSIGPYRLGPSQNDEYFVGGFDHSRFGDPRERT